MTAAKLFETLCAQCGERPQHGAMCIKLRSTGIKEPLCLACFQNGSPEYSEKQILDRRKSPPAADRTWEPAVGEMCEGVTHWNSGRGGGVTVRGKYSREADPGGMFDGAVFLTDEHGYGKAVERSSLRPASPSLPEAQFKVGDRVRGTNSGRHGTIVAARFDGTFDVSFDGPNGRREDGCPTWCFERLYEQATHPPAPERTNRFRCGDWVTTIGDMRRSRITSMVGKGWERQHIQGRQLHVSRVSDDGSGYAESAWVFESDLSPAPEPSRPAEAKVDPYAEHDFVNEGPAATEVANRQRRDKRIAALTASPDPLDRLAASRAKRSAHVESHRASFDVPARVRRDRMTGKPIRFIDGTHPKSWPSNEGED